MFDTAQIANAIAFRATETSFHPSRLFHKRSRFLKITSIFAVYLGKDIKTFIFLTLIKPKLIVTTTFSYEMTIFSPRFYPSNNCIFQQDRAPSPKSIVNQANLEKTTTVLIKEMDGLPKVLDLCNR